MSAAEIIPRHVDTFELPSMQQADFKRLDIHKRRVIYLHLEGVSNKDIAMSLQRTPAWVANVLRNPTVAPVLEALYSDYDAELRGMTGLAVEAIRSNLEQTGDGSLQLKAADLLFKRQGAYHQEHHGGDNAEAVIARFLAAVEDVREERLTQNRLLHLGEGQQTQIADGASPLPEVIDI